MFPKPDSFFGFRRARHPMAETDRNKLFCVHNHIMVAFYSRARTGLALATASIALVATALGRDASRAAPTRAPSPPLASSVVRAVRVDRDVAVLVHMPPLDGKLRQPLALSIVLDRSASLHGEPMEHAKRAAMSLIEKLAADDTFTIVSFSDRDELVLALGAATPERKRDAANAIDRIVASGGTCASCGIARGERELAAAADRRGIHRMVFISDGQASIGIHDPQQLIELAGETAARGTSITAVGVGLDFDELTMSSIATAGHGNYYFAKDTEQLAPMFATELAAMRHIVATHVSLFAEGTRGGAHPIGYPAVQLAGGVAVPVADLGANEATKVVLRSTARAGRFVLTWTDPSDGSSHTAESALSTAFDPIAVIAADEAHAAELIEQSIAAYDQYGPAAAKKLLERAVIGDPLTARAVAAQIEEYDRPGAEAKKSARATAYQLAR